MYKINKINKNYIYIYINKIFFENYFQKINEIVCYYNLNLIAVIICHNSSAEELEQLQNELYNLRN